MKEEYGVLKPIPHLALPADLDTFAKPRDFA
jgi:hypothetical protein